jgi:hypothetical protein
MRLNLLRIWFLATACLAGLEGCRSAAERLPYARDPLLLSKRPVRGTDGAEAPLLLAVAEPEPPALSANAFVALPPASRISPRSPALFAAAQFNPPAEPGKFPVTPAKPVVGTLVPRVKTGSPVQAIPVSLVRNAAKYGHGANFSWMQGMLERSKSGHWLLRYTDVPGDDPWDGKVELKDDPRFEVFSAGDAVEVEGEMLSEPIDGKSLPIYRVSKVTSISRD